MNIQLWNFCIWSSDFIFFFIFQTTRKCQSLGIHYTLKNLWVYTSKNPKTETTSIIERNRTIYDSVCKNKFETYKECIVNWNPFWTCSCSFTTFWWNLRCNLKTNEFLLRNFSRVWKIYNAFRVSLNWNLKFYSFAVTTFTWLKGGF